MSRRPNGCGDKLHRDAIAQRELLPVIAKMAVDRWQASDADGQRLGQLILTLHDADQNSTAGLWQLLSVLQVETVTDLRLLLGQVAAGVSACSLMVAADVTGRSDDLVDLFTMVDQLGPAA